MARYLIAPTPPEDLPPPPPSPRDLDIPDEAWGPRLAFGLLQPGETLDATSREHAGTANITRAAELQNQFLDRQREILHTGPDAFLDTTGRDAVLGADAVLAKLEAARQETLDQAGTAAQRQISLYDGMPCEGLGHPIGTLDDNARLAIALLPGGIAARAARWLLQRPSPVTETEHSEPTIPKADHPSTAAPQLAANREAGEAFERATEDALTQTEELEFARQISVKTKMELALGWTL